MTTKEKCCDYLTGLRSLRTSGSCPVGAIIYPQESFEQVREALNEERFPIMKVSGASLHNTINHLAHAAKSGTPIAFDLSDGLPPALRTHLATMVEGQLAVQIPGETKRTVMNEFRPGFAVALVVEQKQEDTMMLQGLATSFCRVSSLNEN